MGKDFERYVKWVFGALVEYGVIGKLYQIIIIKPFDLQGFLVFFGIGFIVFKLFLIDIFKSLRR